MKQRTTSVEGVVWRLRRRRRPVAAALAALSVAFGLAALRPLDPAGVRILIAAHDLPGGATLRTQDVRSVALPPTAVPDGALRNRATGRVLTGPMRRGEIITDTRLVSGRLLKGYGPGIVAAPVRVADAATIRLLRPGDHVDVLATGTATDPGVADFDLNAPGASTPRPDDASPRAPIDPVPPPQQTPTSPAPQQTGPAGGRALPSGTAGFTDARVVVAAAPVIAVLRDDAETGDQGGLVVLATSREQAAALAGAAGARLSVTIVGE